MPWRALVGNIRDYAIFTLDPDGVLDSWNLGVKQLLGYEEHEWVGQPGGIIFTPEDLAEGADRQELARAREDGEAMDDRWHVRKDGSVFWANGIAHAVRDDNGALVGYLKLMRDQTDKRASQQRLEQKQQLIDAILDSLPGVFYMFDGQRYLRWNVELEKVTGLSVDELATAELEDLVLEGERVRRHVEEVFQKGQATVEAHLRSRDGGMAPYLFESHRVVLEERPVILGLGIEVGDQVRTRRLLEHVALEQSVLAELAASSLSASDVQPIFELAVNRVADTLDAEHVYVVEFRDGDAVTRASSGENGVRVTALSPLREAPADPAPEQAGRDAAHSVPPEVLRELDMSSGIRAPIHGNRRPFGFIAALSRRRAAFTREDGTFLNSVAHLLAGAVERRRLHGELEHRAETDDLTGLLKRVAFEGRLVDSIARAERQGSEVAVLFLDLDDFKRVNDTLGHHAGDEVLVEVARRLRDVVRSWDVVGRHGGDEFVVCLPDVKSRAEVTQVAERLLDAFREPFWAGGSHHAIGATVGIATYPEDGTDVDALLAAADEALYEGKASGRNAFHFFTPPAE